MIIADTSPLNYLILIDAVECLPEIFQEVAVLYAVRQELLVPKAAQKVQRWIENAPSWLKIIAVEKIDENIKLGNGETEAISLAVELSAEAILLDDKAARLSAKERNLQVIGTLGFLKLADEYKLVDFRTAIKKLQETNFRVSEIVLQELLDRYKH